MAKTGAYVRPNRWILGVVTAVALASLQASSYSAEPSKLSSACTAATSTVERLVCTEPALSELDAAMGRAFADFQSRAANPAERGAQLADQRSWLARRQAACPAVDAPGAGATPRGAAREVAVGCLSRIYEQRVAVLRYEANLTIWPNLRFRPTIVEGAGTKLCEGLERDLVASFLGDGRRVNPLGEREIGFAPVPALGNEPVVLRADIDAYNRGEPLPVLLWISDRNGPRRPLAEYRSYDSPAQLLAAIGRGGEPLARSVGESGSRLFDARFTVDNMPRFFRYQGCVYLLGRAQPIPGKPGDLGVYRLYGPGKAARLCVFDAHLSRADLPDNPLSSSAVEALERAAGPLLPTGKMCGAAGEEASVLLDIAARRPWALERTPRGTLNGDGLALYMQNRGLTGPESARQYRAYVAAREAGIEAVGPFYRRQFGRNAADANRLAALFLDRLVSDGFQSDPDDETIASLLAPDYAEKHSAQKAALKGDTAGLLEALGPEPKAVAKGIRGDLDEPLVSDALEHPETLRTLLDMGFDADEMGASGRTPLMMAARLDLLAAATILLAQGASADRGAADAVAQTDGAGDALCMGGEPAEGDTPGRTALSYAAELASPQIVKLLLDAGASARPDSAGRRPADYVKRRTGDPAVAAKIAAMLN